MKQNTVQTEEESAAEKGKMTVNPETFTAYNEEPATVQKQVS